MKKTKTGAKEANGGATPSQLIDARIKELSDWRGETLARVRRLIREADPELVEEVKWRKPSNAMLGVPVWEHDGIVCTGEASARTPPSSAMADRPPPCRGARRSTSPHGRR